MRILMWHVDYFKSEITEKGRSPIVEEFTDRTTQVEDALIVLASVEKADERVPELVAERAAAEIAKQADNLKVRRIVLHPFAHLFAQLGSPKVAIEVLDKAKEQLAQRGFETIRTPFGWFNTLEIKAKGHPISRVARQITAD